MEQSIIQVGLCSVIRTLRIAIIILLLLIITMIKDKFTVFTKCGLVKHVEIKKKISNQYTTSFCRSQNS